MIKNSRVGRAWEATREDEDAAELMGVPTFKFKLLAFAMGAFVGGLVRGAVRRPAGLRQPASPSRCCSSILFLAAVVIGGQGNRWGVMIGAALVAYLPERFRGFEEWRVLMFGLALMPARHLPPAGHPAAATYASEPGSWSRRSTRSRRATTAAIPVRSIRTFPTRNGSTTEASPEERGPSLAEAAVQDGKQVLQVTA